MKILLILPEFETHRRYYRNKTAFHFPFSIWYLGSFLKHYGVEVELIDLNLMQNNDRIIIDRCKHHTIVGISFISSQVPRTRQICRLIREHQPGACIVGGGVHPTLFPEQTVESPLIDFVATGEGELSLLSLLKALSAGKEMVSIPGIYRKDESGKAVHPIGEKQRVDFEHYPALDYTLLDQRMMAAEDKNFVGMVTSRGCPYKCTFCVNHAIKEYNRYTFWDAEKTIEEIEKALVLGFTGVFFWDDNFFANKQRIYDFIRLIKEKELHFEWFAFCRANYFTEHFLSDNLLKQLYEVGLRRVSLGGESGSNRILRMLQKGITKEQVIRSATALEKAGIEASYSFMIGLPGEKASDILNTIEHIGRLGQIQRFPKIVGPMLYCPYPGSELYQICLGAGWRQPADFREWNDETNGTADNPYRLPWIGSELKNMVNTYWFYSFLIPVSFRRIYNVFRLYRQRTRRGWFFFILIVPILFLGFMGKIRHRLRFYRFPMETILLRRFRMIIGA